MTKTYVRFFYPGLLFSNESTQPIASRDLPVTLPKGAFGYQFFDREEIEKDGELLIGKDKNHSGNFYVGTELTAAEALKDAPPNSPLKFNINANEIKRLVRIKSGGMFPLGENDKVISG
jgi:hypothetical protein